jgi:zinc transport system ATP-binding protein
MRREMEQGDAIKLEDVWVEFNHSAILQGVNLRVPRGDYLAILGPNGGGKTTLLRTILGLVTPERGRVQVLGGPPSETRHKIGYVPQSARYDRDFPVSVWDVVLMGRLSHRGNVPGYSKNDGQAAVDALTAMDILDLRDRQIDELSGGQKQRVFIARALAVEPELLLLDEPTSGVDTRVQTNLYDLLADLNKQITIVLVTHDVGVVSSRVSRVACLNHKLIVHDEKQLTKEELEETYLCPVELIAHGLPHRVFEEHE